jgi:GGDEF domain-containing protein
MWRRRSDDWALARNGSTPPASHDDELRAAAVGWLGEVLRAEFPRGGGAAAVVAPLQVGPDVVRRREWLRLWRRLQLPQRLAAYAEELARAASEAAVHAALAEGAAHIVGGFTCLLFVPSADSGELRALPDPRLPFDATLLALWEAPLAPGVLLTREAAAGGPFAALAPLFEQGGAVGLAVAPYGQQGVAVLVERREARVFEREDWRVLALLAGQAEAALERVRLYAGVARLAGSDPWTGLAGRPQAEAVVTHALAAAEWGEPVSVALLALEGLGAAELTEGRASAESLVRGAAEVIRETVADRGISVRYDQGDFLVVLPSASAADAARLVERVRGRLSRALTLHAGIAQRAAPCTAAELIGHAAAAVPRRSILPEGQMK